MVSFIPEHVTMHDCTCFWPFHIVLHCDCGFSNVLSSHFCRFRVPCSDLVPCKFTRSPVCNGGRALRHRSALAPVFLFDRVTSFSMTVVGRVLTQRYLCKFKECFLSQQLIASWMFAVKTRAPLWADDSIKDAFSRVVLPATDATVDAVDAAAVVAVRAY